MREARRGDPTSGEASARRKAVTTSRRWPQGILLHLLHEFFRPITLSFFHSSLLPRHMSHAKRTSNARTTRSKDPYPTIRKQNLQSQKRLVLSLSLFLEEILCLNEIKIPRTSTTAAVMCAISAAHRHKWLRPVTGGWRKHWVSWNYLCQGQRCCPNRVLRKRTRCQGIRSVDRSLE